MGQVILKLDKIDHKINSRHQSLGLLFCCILSCSLPLIAQDQLTNYARNIIAFNQKHPQEKVYLHMDNRSYFIGDTIWFKAYVMNAVSLRPTHTSGVLYVELLNENGVEMAHHKLRIVDGMCYGEFPLKDSYRTGYYEIRAYTRNMLNFGNEYQLSLNDFYNEIIVNEEVYNISEWTNKPSEEKEETTEFEKELQRKLKEGSIDLFGIEHKEMEDNLPPSFVASHNHSLFSRVFPVYMKPRERGIYKEEMDFYPMHTKLSFPQETEIDIRPNNLTLTFFPEGGTLIEEVPSIVAFEAKDQWGRKCHVEGYITEGKNNKIKNFKTYSRGRGTFSLFPEVGKKYYAHVSYKEKNYRFELPETKKEGYVLRVVPPISDGNAMFSVLTSKTTPHELLGWTLQCRGALTAFDTLSVNTNGNAEVTIPSKRLHPGVNQLTLFNTHGEVLADRLFFVSPTTPVATLSLQGMPDSIKPFQAVTLGMNVQDNSYRGTSRGFFSVSVTDADEYPDTYDTSDIRSNLLLTSDLKGFIEDVDSYFNHTSERAMAADIDLLMLVQGWRRYDWKTMTDTNFIPQYTPEEGLQIDGYVISDLISSEDNYLDANSYPRIPNLKMTVLLKNSMVQLIDTCCVDSLGRFHLKFNRYFNDEAPMTILLEERKKTKKWYHHIVDSKTSLKHCYPVIHRAFSPMILPYTYYQWNTHKQDSIHNYDEQINWAMEGYINDVVIRKRFKRKSEIYYENPDMIIDYYREWNNVIDRGTPLLNYRKIFHVKDYIYLQEKDPIKELQGEKKYVKLVNPYIYLNYSLAGRMCMHLDYEQILMYDSICSYYKEHTHKPYIMPKTIFVYSNLIHRENAGRCKDPSTGHRLNAHFVVEYTDKKESPIKPPYMPKEGRRDTYFEGYSRVASFYSPDYSNCALPDTADYRRTLLWVPNVETDFYGNASVRFYNNKQTKHLHVRAEGITEKGYFIVFDSNKQ